MELLKEIQGRGISETAKQPTVHCRVFEDNSGALEMATTHKIRPRTKHINNKYHHFRSKVESQEIEIVAIGTEDQQADILTKAVNQETLHKLRNLMMGW
jgi:hypothetical protein